MLKNQFREVKFQFEALFRHVQIFPRIILASKSPRRHQILRESGFDIEIVELDVNEDFPAELHREQVALYLAEKKSSFYNSPIQNGVLVCADTIVCLENETINKPIDREDAFRMLKKLSGKMHEVFTGVSIKNETKSHSFYERSEVWFHELSDEEIYYYIDNYQPYDKAGSYGVQDWMGYIGVKKINGCFYNVMGFPVAKFYRELQNFLK